MVIGLKRIGRNVFVQYRQVFAIGENARLEGRHVEGKRLPSEVELHGAVAVQSNARVERFLIAETGEETRGEGLAEETRAGDLPNTSPTNHLP